MAVARDLGWTEKRRARRTQADFPVQLFLERGTAAARCRDFSSTGLRIDWPVCRVCTSKTCMFAGNRLAESLGGFMKGGQNDSGLTVEYDFGPAQARRVAKVVYPQQNSAGSICSAGLEFL